MRQFNKIWTALLMSASMASASAGLHSICYEGPLELRPGVPVLKMVVGCHDDSGAACSIGKPTAVQYYAAPVPGNAPTWPLAQDRLAWQAAAAVSAAGTFDYFEFENAKNLRVRFTVPITFHGNGQNSQTRVCTVDARGKAAQGAIGGDGFGVLTGFSTDVSGLATTGVWRHEEAGNTAAVRVPGDFIAVGGGAEAQPGAFIRYSTFSDNPGDWRTWRSGTYTPSRAMPASTQSYTIGLRIQGLYADLGSLFPGGHTLGAVTDLIKQMGQVDANSPGATGPGQQVPTVSAGLPAPRAQVLLGAGIKATAAMQPSNGFTEYGQFASASAPSSVTRHLNCLLTWLSCPPPSASDWRVESLSEVGQHPGWVSTHLRHMPSLVTLDGKRWEVRGRYVQATSRPDLSPGVQAAGLRGEYAVTSVGASMNWRRFDRDPTRISSALTKIVPLLDLGGAEVAAANGSTASTSTVTAYALGIKLVPEGTPPDAPEPPVSETVSASWACTAVPLLMETSLCTQQEEEAITAALLCARYPDVQKTGLCRKVEKP